MRMRPVKFDQQYACLKRGNLSVNCGGISTFAVELLGKLGWKVRTVSCLRMEGAFNTYNNGHVLNEFYWPQYRKWVMVDLDTGQLFKRGKMYLNAADVTDLVRNGREFELEPLTASPMGALDSTCGVMDGLAACGGRNIYQHGESYAVDAGDVCHGDHGFGRESLFLL